MTSQMFLTSTCGVLGAGYGGVLVAGAGVRADGVRAVEDGGLVAVTLDAVVADIVAHLPERRAADADPVLKHMCRIQYWALLNFKKTGSGPVLVRFQSGSGNLNCVIISCCFAIFKNVAHSLEPGETPNNSASHRASNYVQRS